MCAKHVYVYISGVFVCEMLMIRSKRVFGSFFAFGGGNVYDVVLLQSGFNWLLAA